MFDLKASRNLRMGGALPLQEHQSVYLIEKFSDLKSKALHFGRAFDLKFLRSGVLALDRIKR